MKASYALIVMVLCLNLATWATEQAGIFTAVNPLTPFNPQDEYTKWNGTNTIDTIIKSQDPTGGTDYVNMGLGILGSMLFGLVFAFPQWCLSVPYVPTYVSWIVILIYMFTYMIFVIQLAMGRDIEGS